METFSALLVLCAGNSSVTGEFPTQRPVTRNFDVFFDLRRNKQLSKQSRRRWFQTPEHSLWRHCNAMLWRLSQRHLVSTASITTKHSLWRPFGAKNGCNGILNSGPICEWLKRLLFKFNNLWCIMHDAFSIYILYYYFPVWTHLYQCLNPSIFHSIALHKAVPLRSNMS